jgi:hypothetical protein
MGLIFEAAKVHKRLKLVNEKNKIVLEYILNSLVKI